MLQFSETPPLALYIHFPWCVKKCPYCDFNSHEAKENIPEEKYIDALLIDIDIELPAIWGRSITSIFMGGGTPSLFSAKAITRLMSELRARLNFNPDIEITMESNPGTAEYENYAGYFQAGINRLSIGVQSFNSTHLKTLGRIHSADDAQNAIRYARQAGFNNLNLDLMYGLPQQTAEQARTDLQTALEQRTAHISYYQLTLEENTYFHRFPPVLPDDDALYAIEQASHQLLADNNYQHYEISAFAQNDQHSRHNKNYWQFGDYIGIGAGAHSKRTDVQQQSIVRYSKPKNPRDYLATAENRNFSNNKNSLTESSIQFEFMLNALRLTNGVEKELFNRRTGTHLNAIRKNIEIAQQKKLLEVSLDRIKPTELGLRYLNDLQSLFLDKD